MGGPPDFRPAEGKPLDVRVQRIESWAGNQAQWASLRSEEVGGMILDLERRVAKLETWKIDVLVFIGSLKIKWGFVMLLAGIVSSVLTLGVAKLLHL